MPDIAKSTWREDVRTVPVPMGRLLTANQAAAVLCCSDWYVRKLAEDGRLDRVETGGRVWFTRKSVLALQGALEVA